MTKERVQERKRLSAPAKAWSHQNELAAKIGCRIHVRTIDGSNSEGVLEAADNFTIRVLINQDAYIIFKSAISCFVLGKSED